MLHRWNTEVDGELNEANFRAKLEGLGYEVCRYVYPPGTTFQSHAHDLDKIDAVLAGQFRVVLEDEEIAEIVLEPGDAIEVPRGRRHRAEVVGHHAVISLDAIRI